MNRRGSQSKQRRVVRDKEMSKDVGSADLPRTDAGGMLTPNQNGSRTVPRDNMNNDENTAAKPDSYVNPRPRSRVRNESDTDPYVALRVSNSSRIVSAKAGGVHHGPVRIADSRVRRRTSTQETNGSPSDPYVHLKIAGSQISGADTDDDVGYETNGSVVSGDVTDSAGSNYEDTDDELSEFGSDDIDEDYDQDFATGRAKVLIGGSESHRHQGDDHSETSNYARLSVAGSTAKFQENAHKLHTVYARLPVSVTSIGYDKDKFEELPGFVSDSGRDGYARISRAGSETGQGYTRVSVAGSDIDRGQDLHAKLSIAGSDTEYARDADIAGDGKAAQFENTYARVSVAGSEDDYGKHMKAKNSVAGSEVESERNFDGDTSGYARLTVVGSKLNRTHGDVSDSEESQHSLTGTGRQLKREVELSNNKSQDDEDEELWEKEFETYLERGLESQARLQYRMRVLLISPLYESTGRRLSSFSDLYKNKFGEHVQLTGFTSVSRLCRAMPDVVQIKQVEETPVLMLVDSSRNRRSVSGIRSGLRRIAYDTLKSCDALSGPQFEDRCSKLLGKPLVEVLREHGYENPTVESLVNDVQDIVAFEKMGLDSRVYLCSGAQDPALTDGLLIKSSNNSNLKTSSIAEPKEDSDGNDKNETAKDSDIQQSYSRPESLKVGSSLTLRSLKNELRRCGSFSQTLLSPQEDEILQARLRMRILLAFQNRGHGVEAAGLMDLYAECFGRPLDLQQLRAESVTDLVRNWHDIFLLQDPKPGWVFLVPSQANRRILNTLRTGLRSSVYSVLVETYPEGLEPLDFLLRLQQVMSGELWEVLDVTGYVCSDAEKIEGILNLSSGSEFQLIDFEEVCILLEDMMDFVRLGSNEDGSVIIRLRNKEAPLVDLSDCKLVETDVQSFDELFVNLMMIAVDDNETSGSEDNCLDNGGIISVGHVQSLVNSFEGSGGLRSAHSQSPDSLRFKQEIRLILGCPEYLENGLAWTKLSSVYRDRTGQELGSKSKVKSLLRAMPDIVSKDSFAGDLAYLFKTPKNLRILSTTKAGFRQVLFWALVKNPRGVWASLLEGWFTDFAGMSLAASLQIHGYEGSKSRPFFPVHVFLKDMSDLLLKKSAPFEVFNWAGEVKDPVHQDACLLGLSELLIQYDPVKSDLGKVTVMERLGVEESSDESFPKEVDPEVVLVEDLEDKTHLKEEKVESEANIAHGIGETSSAREDEHDVDANVEGKFAFDAKSNQVMPTKDTKLGQENLPIVVKEERCSEENCLLGDLEAGQKLGDEKHDELAGNSDCELLGLEAAQGQQDDQISISENQNEDVLRELDHDDMVIKDDSNRVENVASVREDDNLITPHDEEMGWNNGEQMSESNLEEYAQLRVAGKGPKVNLDEWQFTDSEEEISGGENEFEDKEDSEYSEYDNLEDTEQDSTLPRITYVDPKVKVTTQDTSRAWVLPSKDGPWK